MPRKRTLKEIKEREYLKLSELAELNEVRYSTIKYYSELGILPYKQEEQRLAKYFPRVEASERLKEIFKLKKKRMSINEIVEYFNKK